MVKQSFQTVKRTIILIIRTTQSLKCFKNIARQRNTKCNNETKIQKDGKIPHLSHEAENLSALD